MYHTGNGYYQRQRIVVSNELSGFVPPQKTHIIPTYIGNLPLNSTSTHLNLLPTNTNNTSIEPSQLQKKKTSNPKLLSTTTNKMLNPNTHSSLQFIVEMYNAALAFAKLGNNESTKSLLIGSNENRNSAKVASGKLRKCPKCGQEICICDNWSFTKSINLWGEIMGAKDVLVNLKQ